MSDEKNEFDQSRRSGRAHLPRAEGGTPGVGQDKNFAANQIIYSPDDPAFAMRNALQMGGINPYRANPLLQRFMQAAGGLGMAFRMSNAGTGPSDILSGGGEGQMFQNFLADKINSGSVYSTLASASQGLGGLLGQIRGFQDQGMTDPATGQSNPAAALANPFLAQLNQLFATPEGLMGAMNSLNQPLMGRSMGAGYRSALEQMFDQGKTNYYRNDPTGTADKNWWEYLGL